LENLGTQDIARGDRVEPNEIVVAEGCQKPVDRAFPDPQLSTDFGQSTSDLRGPEVFDDIQCFDQ
jgi:hypothetical protein